jgi:two-component system cell cycle response regulator DivK
MAKRILVIEDTDDNRRILRDLLTNAGFEVIEALDGAAGVALALAERPDLILMDIQLPIVDGYEASRQIKSNPELRNIPIIAITSYALAGDEEKTAAAGCEGYLAKPVSPRQVLAMVRDFLGKATSGAAATRVDTGTR